jgi:hypothetical protein
MSILFNPEAQLAMSLIGLAMGILALLGAIRARRRSLKALADSVQARKDVDAMLIRLLRAGESSGVFDAEEPRA